MQANLTAALAQLTIPTPANSSALSDTQLTAVLGGSALLGDAFALGFAGHLPPAAMLQAAAAAAAAPAAATGLGWFLLLLPVVRHLEALATLLLAAPEPCRSVKAVSCMLLSCACSMMATRDHHVFSWVLPLLSSGGGIAGLEALPICEACRPVPALSCILAFLHSCISQTSLHTPGVLDQHIARPVLMLPLPVTILLHCQPCCWQPQADGQGSAAHVLHR